MNTVWRFFWAACLGFCITLRAADIQWTNRNNGSWHSAINWSPNQVPGAGDRAFITTNVLSPGISLSSDVTLDSLLLKEATVSGAGSLTITDSMTWISGGMNGTGRTIIEPGATLTFAVSTFVDLFSRTLEIGGTCVWTGTGTLQGQSGAVITNRPGALFEIQSGGVTFFPLNSVVHPRFDNAGTFRKTGSAGTVTFDNYPTYGIYFAFNNFNVADIQAGTLLLKGGGTNTGSFDVPSDATLNLGGGTHLSSVASSITGAGHLTMSGNSTITLAGLVNVTGTNLVNFNVGTANLTGNYLCTNNTLNILNGTANFSGPGTVAPTLLNLSGGDMTGTNIVTVGGVMNWSGGTMSGAGRTVIEPGATLNIANPSAINLISRTLDNAGSIIWAGAGNIQAASCIITNRPGALFEARGTNANFLFNGGAPRFDNAGVFRKTISAATTAFGTGIAFNNYATTEILAGTLTLQGGGTNSSSMSVATGAAVNFLAGTFRGGAASALTGDGQLTVSGGTVTLAGSVNVSGTNLFSGGTASLTGNYTSTNSVLIVSGGTVNVSGSYLSTSNTVNVTSGTLNLTGSHSYTNNALNLSGGTANFSGPNPALHSVVNLSGGAIGGSGVLTVASVMNWTGGNLGNGGGRTVIAPDATLMLSNAADVSLNGYTLDNAGTVLWTGAGNLKPALSGGFQGVITNRPGALFEVRNNTTFYRAGGGAGSPRFDNAGIFRKTVGTGTTAFNGDFGQGPAFNNFGTVEILSGIVVANGGYTSTAGALLHSAISGTTAGTGFGQLQVANTVTLQGALRVALANGFYPNTNAAFPVLTAGARSGTFANFYFPSNDVGMAMSNNAANVTVHVINVRPVLAAIAGQTNSELVSFSYATTATDADVPVQSLTYSLSNAPAGASISGSGVIAWTPTEEQGPLTTNMTVRVTDNGQPNLTVWQTFQIVVPEINVAPVLTLPADFAFDELTPYTNNATATDEDLPANTLTFELVSGPAGLLVETNGAISWTPAEAQGPSNHVVSIRVTDLNTNAINAQQISVTNSFTLTVRESNSPPVLIVPGPQTVVEETSLAVSASATDPDEPANALTFSLVSPPSGLTIDPNTGAMLWAPTEAQGSNTYPVTVVVTDDSPLAVNATHLSTTNTFLVTVLESNRPPVFTLPASTNIEELIIFTTSVVATDPDLPANALTFALLDGPSGLTLSPSGVIDWTPSAAQGPGTNEVLISVTDSSPFAMNATSFSVTNTFTIVVIDTNTPPVLSNSVAGTAFNTTLVLNTNKLLRHAVDAEGDALSITGASSTNGGTLTFGGELLTYTPATNYSGADRIDYFVSDGHNGAVAHVFVTVRPGNAIPANILSIVTQGGTNVAITFAGIPNRYYIVQTATNVAVPISDWQPVFTNLVGPSGIWGYTNPILPGLQFFRTAGGTLEAP